MAILDLPSLATALNQPDLLDGTDDGYADQVIADAAAQVAGYLGYDPVLAVVTGEEGVVTYVQSGSYVGRYNLRLAHAPLVPGLAPAIFAQLQLTYGLATLPNAAVNLDTVTVLHSTGQIFTLAPGAVEALTWQYGMSPGVQAVGYVANYVAGYATGINDPVPNGGGAGFTATTTITNGSVSGVTVTSAGTGYTSPPLLILASASGSGAVLQATISNGAVGSVSVLAGGSGYIAAPTISVSSATSYGALPMPAGITQAAVLLCRERLAMDNAGNADTSNVSAGAVIAKQTGVNVRRYAAPARLAASRQPLGFGTALSQAAATRLDPYARVFLPLFL